MSLVLHTSHHSWSAMCVDLLLHLANIPAQRVLYDLTPGLWQTRSSVPLRALNPARRVPVLVVDGGRLVLTESATILRYLADVVVPNDSAWARDKEDVQSRAKIDGEF
jgi:glutathione S-transferase